MEFRTEDGVIVPAITAAQMREVDRIVVEEFGLSILQMMENAGRNLAQNVQDMLDGTRGEVAILAGSGGNGGGGLCCARHLRNRDFSVWVVLDREKALLRDAARHQLQILRAAGVRPVDPFQAREVLRRSQVVVDALIGYSLRGAPRGRAAELIDLVLDRYKHHTPFRNKENAILKGDALRVEENRTWGRTSSNCLVKGNRPP